MQRWRCDGSVIVKFARISIETKELCHWVEIGRRYVKLSSLLVARSKSRGCVIRAHWVKLGTGPL
jgi:hypothetical protein